MTFLISGARKFLVLVIPAIAHLLCAASVRAQDQVTIHRTPLATEISDRTVAFLARDLETGIQFNLEGSELLVRNTPWSTFKIPNLLIALETGVAPNVDTHREWDPIRRPAANYWPKTWRTGQTLRSAFERSAAWYFQDLALEIGASRYREYLAEWSYGNVGIADGSDSFWLDRTLKVSVKEQVDFLARLLNGDLNVDRSSIDALLLASLEDARPGFALHGKTGSGPIAPDDFDGPFEGWYCGFVLRPNAKPIVFALYTKAPTYSGLRTFRKSFSVRLLKDANLLPPEFPH